MEDLTIKVAEYEGPMDVLLHLIREMKIDIYDIPMNELTKQYLNFIHSMKTLELEVAAEYLVMASTLLEIKARMLLPKPKLEELDEDGEPIVEDPRDQLVQQLLEYQQIKENAKKLETHTVEELMDSIISKIEHTDKKQVPFEECFPAFNRHAITTTFLAMLQLVREHRVRFIQSSPYEDILIEKRQEKEKESD